LFPTFVQTFFFTPFGTKLFSVSVDHRSSADTAVKKAWVWLKTEWIERVLKNRLGIIKGWDWRGNNLFSIDFFIWTREMSVAVGHHFCCIIKNTTT
jgi:hypothetical protein